MDTETKNKMKEAIIKSFRELELDESLVDYALEIPDAILNGKTTVGEVFNITTAQQESLYSLAYDLYTNKKYDKATKVFDLLCIINPTERKYWIGAAGCKKLLHEYHAAIIYYTNMNMLWPAQLMIYLDLSECLIKLNMLDEAKACLNALISICKKPAVLKLNNGVNGEYAESKAKILLNIISNLLTKREDKDN